jgi:ubiquitin-conjugating enzyme E2 D
MSNIIRKRIMNELEEIQNNPVENCSAAPVNNDIFHWEAIIIGPSDTPYEKGIFKLDIKFGEFYPFKPPHVYFKTKIYHCNINIRGGICLDILKNEWSPALTISNLLLSICSLLAEPNPNDPLRPEIAELLKKNKIQHNSIAREYTIEYAN